MREPLTLRFRLFVPFADNAGTDQAFPLALLLIHFHRAAIGTAVLDDNVSAAMPVEGHFVAAAFYDRERGLSLNLPCRNVVSARHSRHGIFLDVIRCYWFDCASAVRAMRDTSEWSRSRRRDAMRRAQLRESTPQSSNRDQAPEFAKRYAIEINTTRDRLAPTLPAPAVVNRTEVPVRAGGKKPPQPRVADKQTAIHKWLPPAAGGLALAIGLLAASHFIAPRVSGTAAVSALMRAEVSNTRLLLAAIKAAGLKGTINVKGAIDGLKRLDASRVAISGWAAQIGNSGAALTVLMFVDGKAALATRTTGRHPDVISALGASDAPGAENVSFAGTAPCARGQKLIVVAVTDDNTYGYFGTRHCP